jgi:DNA-binding NtrC family response regulator
MPRILIVDDQLVFLKLLDKLLKGQGYQTVTARDGLEAMALLENDTFDVMVSDIRMQPLSGLDLLRQTRIFHKQMCVIMLTACDTLETAIQAMKLGAFDYLTKPFKVEDLTQTVQHALEYSKTTINSKPLRVRLEYHEGVEKLSGMVAQSVPMQKVCDTIERVAPTHTTVLICGEAGSGKELAARNLHRYSPRKEKPFLKIDCAALPPAMLEAELFGNSPDLPTRKNSLFVAAAGGSLYIHEIGDLPLRIQGKLLETLKEARILQARNPADISVRIFASSTVNLEQRVREGAFSEELYRRLCTIRIDIPPLRDRPEDVLPLVGLALKRYANPGEEPPTLDQDAGEILKRYSWPGNVSQLEAVVRKALAFRIHGAITSASLPAELVSEVVDSPVPATTPAGEQLKGKALKAFLRAKGQEALKQPVNSGENRDTPRPGGPRKASRRDGSDAAADESASFDWI